MREHAVRRHGTVLLVDGRLPVDVIFDASVWEEDRQKGERAGQQASGRRVSAPRAPGSGVSRKIRDPP